MHMHTHTRVHTHEKVFLPLGTVDFHRSEDIATPLPVKEQLGAIRLLFPKPPVPGGPSTVTGSMSFLLVAVSL